MKSWIIVLCALVACDSKPDAGAPARTGPAAPPVTAREAPQDASPAPATSGGLSKAEIVAALTKDCQPRGPGNDLRCFGTQQQLLKKGARATLQDIDRDYQARCDAGDAEACYWAGRVDEQGRDPAPALLVRACDSGFIGSCFVIAYRTFDTAVALAPGPERTRLFAQAVTWFTSSCEARMPGACLAVAWLYFEGSGVPQDRDRALAIADEACRGGDADGCKDATEMRCLRDGRSDCATPAE